VFTVLVWGGVCLHKEDRKGIHIHDNISSSPSMEDKEEWALDARENLMEPAHISDRDFTDIIATRAQTLLGLANYLCQCESYRSALTRPFLGELLSQSIQMEELLDTYDARNNCRWCLFRSLVAGLKLFSDVSYELLHIQHALPAYCLLSIEHDFVKATDESLDFTGQVLVCTADRTIRRARELGLPVPSENFREQSYTEQITPGRLPHDCSARKKGTASEMVTMLATAFLNLAAESEGVRMAARAKPGEYPSYLASSVTEEKLRSLELRFHNLQSLYDTYVSGTEVEYVDSDLPVLRGHISVVFHLLSTATLFAHYYERHLSKESCEKRAAYGRLVDSEALLERLMNYSILHIGLYIGCAEQLCQEMLKRYSEVGEIEVSVPRYRGFHVRPSTLVSKLVLHYGGDVHMEMGGDKYDARSPLELFRANEKINAEKRRWLASEIVKLKIVDNTCRLEDIQSVVRQVILAMAGRSRLILYEQPLQMPAEPASKEGSLLQRVTDEMARLLAMGKIDIEANLNARFIGDKRVLADIRLLAECGYGEDKFGNNIPLPDGLKYLRR